MLLSCSSTHPKCSIFTVLPKKKLLCLCWKHLSTIIFYQFAYFIKCTQRESDKGLKKDEVLSPMGCCPPRFLSTGPMLCDLNSHAILNPVCCIFMEEVFEICMYFVTPEHS